MKETLKQQEDEAGAALRVVVVDDHARIRWAVRELLESPTCQIVAEAADGPGGMAAVCLARPDVVITDLRMPGCDGLELAEQVRALLPKVRVVLFTAEPPSDDRCRAVDAVVSKGAMPQELLRAVTGNDAEGRNG